MKIYRISIKNQAMNKYLQKKTIHHYLVVLLNQILIKSVIHLLIQQK